MNIIDLPNYRCPICHAGQMQLVNRKTEEAQIDSGTIECKSCAAQFPIVRALPRFVARENYADSFGFQWNIHAKTQLDSFSNLPISRDRVFSVTRWNTSLNGERILEAGSGAGRFTEILLGTGAEVWSFDFSTAVDANASNNGPRANLHLFQGDIFNIPLEPETFDKVFCLGVLQHTPDPARAFASLARYVRPGGELAIDAYRKDFAALLQWKYLLRPITRRMRKEVLYRVIEKITPCLVPLARLLRSTAGRAGARLVPIVEYAHLGLPDKLNKQWAILDTFDMYSPAHDHPQSLEDVRNWFKAAGFINIDVRMGPNGVVGTGKRPCRPLQDGGTENSR